MKNIAKTLLALMLVLCLLTSFVACGNNNEEPENNEPDTEQDETPDNGEDDPAPEAPKNLTDAGANTEDGWSDMK
jgi:hypothetical protein